jgi:hypothetical protein
MRATGQGATIVGEYAAEATKSFDLSRSTAVRSAVDDNVVYQFETQEAVLDYAFDRLGITVSLKTICNSAARAWGLLMHAFCSMMLWKCRIHLE